MREKKKLGLVHIVAFGFENNHRKNHQISGRILSNILFFACGKDERELGKRIAIAEGKRYNKVIYAVSNMAYAFIKEEQAHEKTASASGGRLDVYKRQVPWRSGISTTRGVCADSFMGASLS